MNKFWQVAIVLPSGEQIVSVNSWLRSPGNTESNAANLNTNGNVNNNTLSNSNSARPDLPQLTSSRRVLVSSQKPFREFGRSVMRGKGICFHFEELALGKKRLRIIFGKTHVGSRRDVRARMADRSLGTLSGQPRPTKRAFRLMGMRGDIAGKRAYLTPAFPCQHRTGRL